MTRLGLIAALVLAPLAFGAEPLIVAKTEVNQVKVSVHHTLTREEAKVRITQLLTYWGTRFGVKSEWNGFQVFLSGIVWGVEIRGLFDVEEHDVFALAHDPGTSLRRLAEEYVGKKLKKYLHPTYQEP